MREKRILTQGLKPDLKAVSKDGVKRGRWWNPDQENRVVVIFILCSA